MWTVILVLICPQAKNGGECRLCPSNSSGTDIEDTVRRCIREEMKNFQSGRAAPTTLLNRTRSFMQSAASSASSFLSGNGPSQLNQDQGQRQSGTLAIDRSNIAGLETRQPYSHSPGHPFPPQKRKSTSKCTPTPMPKAVYLLEMDGDDSEPEEDNVNKKRFS